VFVWRHVFLLNIFSFWWAFYFQIFSVSSRERLVSEMTCYVSSGTYNSTDTRSYLFKINHMTTARMAQKVIALLHVVVVDGVS